MNADIWLDCEKSTRKMNVRFVFWGIVQTICIFLYTQIFKNKTDDNWKKSEILKVWDSDYSRRRTQFIMIRHENEQDIYHRCMREELVEIQREINIRIFVEE